MINKLLWEIGVQWEKYLGYVCDGGGTYPDVYYPDGKGGYKTEKMDTSHEENGDDRTAGKLRTCFNFYFRNRFAHFNSNLSLCFQFV